MTTERLVQALRALAEDVCLSPADVERTLKAYQLPPGLAEEVRALLEATPAPREADGG